MAKQDMGLMLGMLILGIALQQGAVAVIHEVGDELGWSIPTDESFYSSWASKQTFHVGDELGDHYSLYSLLVFFFFLIRNFKA